MKFGGRGPPFPDADLIRALAALLSETASPKSNTRSAIAAFVSPVLPPPPRPSGGRPLPSLPPRPVEHAGAVKAPMVGTAYLAPQPGDPPFVRLGDSVAEGQPLLIIEAMKVMNQIRAPRSGRIAQILVADAQPVEYGAVLMLIE